MNLFYIIVIIFTIIGLLLLGLGVYYYILTQRICPSGKFKNNAQICTDCEPGHYTDTSNKSSTCKACIAGQYQPDSGKNSCINCPPGKYQPFSGKSNCINCEKGTYQDKFGEYKCKSCDKGTYQDKTGMPSCSPCPSGSYQDKTGMPSCSPCPSGSYQDKTGMTGCIPCPSGSYQDKTGMTGCITCSIGILSDPNCLNTICKDSQTPDATFTNCINSVTQDQDKDNQKCGTSSDYVLNFNAKSPLGVNAFRGIYCNTDIDPNNWLSVFKDYNIMTDKSDGGTYCSKEETKIKLSNHYYSGSCNDIFNDWNYANIYSLSFNIDGIDKNDLPLYGVSVYIPSSHPTISIIGDKNGLNNPLVIVRKYFVENNIPIKELAAKFQANNNKMIVYIPTTKNWEFRDNTTGNKIDTPGTPRVFSQVYGTLKDALNAFVLA
jgi:hypothetical protein